MEPKTQNVSSKSSVTTFVIYARHASKQICLNCVIKEVTVRVLEDEKRNASFGQNRRYMSHESFIFQHSKTNSGLPSNSLFRSYNDVIQVTIIEKVRTISARRFLLHIK
jgi:predicted aminopeptidase